jgi:hypothetical protein
MNETNAADPRRRAELRALDAARALLLAHDRMAQCVDARGMPRSEFAAARDDFETAYQALAIFLAELDTLTTAEQ